MTNIVYPICALLAWIFVLTGARRLSRMRRTPERLAVWVMFLAFALVFTVGSSPLRRHLDGFAGIAEFSTWLAQSLVVCYSAAALCVLQLWNYPPVRARRRIMTIATLLVVVQAAMAALFFLSNPVHARNHHFVHWYAASGYFDTYLGVYLVSYAAATIEIARQCRHFARLMTRSWLRTGLHTSVVGALVSLVYVADRTTDVIVAHLGVSLAGWDALPEAGAGIGSLLIIVGMTAGMWGPKASGVALRFRRLRGYVRLRPLWEELYEIDPGIALDRPRRGITRWRSVLRLARDLDYEVSRRVLEVRDGILALHPYLDTHVTQQARAAASRRGLSGTDLDAWVEAAQIHAALKAIRRPDAPRTQAQHGAMNNAPADLDAELMWLSAVAKHFTKSADLAAQVPGAAVAR